MKDSNETPLGAQSSFACGIGKWDTRNKPTFSDGRINPNFSKIYPIAQWQDVVALALSPQAPVAKESGAWILASSYNLTDARNHDIQRDRGCFEMLWADIDEGNLPKEEVLSVLRKILGSGNEFLIYNTRSSQPDSKKWRVLIPLAVKNKLTGFGFICYQKSLNDALVA